jgi:type IV pilus assembly protein PilO
MKKNLLPSIVLPQLNFTQLAEDFKTLDMKDPGLWPLGPKLVILIGVFLALIGISWFVGWSAQLDELDAYQQKEKQLKDEWLDKKRQAVNLEAYRKQKEEIDRSFGELLKQLPNKAEMDAMIVDISQAALTRGLKIDLFKPGVEAKKDFYAEMPISIQMYGGYNDMALFSGDLARLPRIVTLNNIKLKPKDNRANVLSLDGTVMTYRYLDTEELAAQKKQQKGKPGASK